MNDEGEVFSRMRSEGFSFNFGSLRVELCLPDDASVFATVCNRSQPSATVCNCSNPAPMALSLGRALESDFSWRQDVLVIVYYIAKCNHMT